MTTEPPVGDVTPSARSRASRPPARDRAKPNAFRLTTGRIVAGGVSLTATFGMVAAMGLAQPASSKPTVVLDATSGAARDDGVDAPEATEQHERGADGGVDADDAPADATTAPVDATTAPSPVTTTGGVRPGVSPTVAPAPAVPARPAGQAVPAPTAVRPTTAPAPAAVVPVAPRPTASTPAPAPAPAPTVAPPKPKPTTPPTTVTKAS